MSGSRGSEALASLLAVSVVVISTGKVIWRGARRASSRGSGASDEDDEGADRGRPLTDDARPRLTIGRRSNASGAVGSGSSIAAQDRVLLTEGDGGADGASPSCGERCYWLSRALQTERDRAAALELALDDARQLLRRAEASAQRADQIRETIWKNQRAREAAKARATAAAARARAETLSREATCENTPGRASDIMKAASSFVSLAVTAEKKSPARTVGLYKRALDLYRVGLARATPRGH